MRSSLSGKIINIILVFSLIVGCVAMPTTVYSMTVYSEDRYMEPITSGVEMESITQYTSEGTLKIHVMTVDLSNPYVKVDTITSSNGKLTNSVSVTKMTSDAGAVAGINGDFFQMNEKAPIGLTVKNGEIISSPVQRTDMYGFGFTQSNYPFIDIFSFQGQVQTANGQSFPLYGVNKPTYLAVNGSSPDVDRLNLYTHAWGTNSRGKLPSLSSVMEVVVENDVVKEIRTDQPGVAIPTNGYVLAAHGKAADWIKANLKVGTAISASYQIMPDGDKLMAAVGGQAMLVNYGVRSWFSQNITGKRARTAIGYTQDRKTMFLVVVEGGSSRGMTQEELADFMVSLGCWQALNLDGGGSSTIAARMLGEQQVTLLNTPAAGSQRAVPNGIGIFSTAPKGVLAGFKIKGEKYGFVGASRTYTAKGYDEYYNPFHVEPGQITWDVDPSFGYFDGNVFTAIQSGRIFITASANGASENFEVHILGAADVAKIEIVPAAVELNEGDIANLSVAVTAKNGVQFSLQGSEVEWEVTGDVGQVNGDNFVASNSRGVGQITAIVDSLRVSAPVSIGSTEKPFSGLEAFNDYKFSGHPAEVKGSFRAASGNEPVFRGIGAARLEYDFSKTTATRAAYGRFSENGITLPGRPIGMGVRVHGSGGNNHWLRAKIVDAAGTEKLIDLSQGVNWQGWKHVRGKFPANLKYPIKLASIYLVETDPNKLGKGVIYLDELTLFMPVTAQELVSSPAKTTSLNLIPQQTNKATLGDLEIDFPAEGIKANTITISEERGLDLASPGYSPILPGFKVTGYKEGSQVLEVTKPYTITLSYNGTVNPRKLRLMIWKPNTQSWSQVPLTVEGNGKVKAKAEGLGMFFLMEDASNTPSFNDINNSWAKNKIEEMAARGIVSGFPGNKFMPNKGVTRAEFVVLMAKAFGWSTEKNQSMSFKDKLPGWAEGSIAAAVERGVVAGYNDGTFKADKMISRAEMAVIINNCLRLEENKQPSGYSDGDSIPGWAVQAIRNTKAAGLMQGHNNMFRPKDTASRAEATVVIDNMLTHYLK